MDNVIAFQILLPDTIALSQEERDRIVESVGQAAIDEIAAILAEKFEEEND